MVHQFIVKGENPEKEHEGILGYTLPPQRGLTRISASGLGKDNRLLRMCA
jgi:hypothetical protein